MIFSELIREFSSTHPKRPDTIQAQIITEPIRHVLFSLKPVNSRQDDDNFGSINSKLDDYLLKLKEQQEFELNDEETVQYCYELMSESSRFAQNTIIRLIHSLLINKVKDLIPMFY